MSSKPQNPKVAGMDRRTFMKGCTITASAIALGGIPTVGAVDYPWDEQIEEGFEAMAPDTYSGGLAYAFGPGIGVPINVIQHVTQDSDLSTEAPILWTTAIGEGEAYVSFTQMVNNYLQDTNTIAAIEGRSAIADAYVDNLSASEAKTAFDDAVMNYYSTLQGNAWRTISSYIAQLAYIQTIARNNGDIVDFFVSTDLPTVTDSSGATADPDGNRYMDSTNFVENQITAVNSQDFTVQFPTFHIPASDGSAYEGGITQSILDTYDTSRSDGAFQVETDSGVTMALDFDFIVANVPEGDNMPSKGLFSLKDFMQIHEEISSQAANIITSFDQAFVDDLYAAMDNGDISPTDVRGASALARQMGGTDDVYADSYRMAMLQQLGMEQPDLTELASMTISYKGFTGINGNVTESGNRRLRPTNYANTTYEGLMFAGDTPSGGFSIDETYIADPLAFINESGTFKAINILTGETLWEESVSPNFIQTSANGQYVIRDNGSEIECLNLNGNIEWTISVGANKGIVTNENELWLDNGTIYDIDSGESVSSFNNGGGGEGKWHVSASGNTYAYWNGSEAGYVVMKDGEEITTLTNQSFNGGNEIVCGDQYIISAINESSHIHNLESGETTQMVSRNMSTDPDSAIPLYNESEGIVWIYNNSNNVNARTYKYDIESGTSSTSSAFNHLIKVNSEQFEYFSSGRYEIHGNGIYDTVNESLAFSTGNIDAGAISFWQKGGFDGFCANVVFYDAYVGTERQLNNGIITIDDMTNRDGETIDNINTDPPDYGDYDNTEYIKEIQKAANTTIQIFQNESSGGGIPNYSGPNFDPGDWVPDSILGNTFGIPNWAIALLGGTGFLVAIKAFFSRN